MLLLKAAFVQVTLWPVRKGHGFFYERNPLVPVSRLRRCTLSQPLTVHPIPGRVHVRPSRLRWPVRARGPGQPAGADLPGQRSKDGHRRAVRHVHEAAAIHVQLAASPVADPPKRPCQSGLLGVRHNSLAYISNLLFA